MKVGVITPNKALFELWVSENKEEDNEYFMISTSEDIQRFNVNTFCLGKRYFDLDESVINNAFEYLAFEQDYDE